MSVANSYARALYEAAKEQGVSSDGMNQLEKEMDALQSFLYSSKEFAVALFSPLTTSREKIALVEEIGKKLRISKLLNDFVILLARKGRLLILNQVRDSFSSIRLTQEGGLAGHVVAAEPMSDEDLGTLAKVFGQKFGKQVAFRVATDPSLLAGMKVTVNGVTYDGTLRSQLQKLRDRFVAGPPSGTA